MATFVGVRGVVETAAGNGARSLSQAMSVQRLFSSNLHTPFGPVDLTGDGCQGIVSLKGWQIKKRNYAEVAPASSA
ncbi:hypothetical protein [[Phormidium] sp. ETS-05]|uniref:hypothetical protein n=1 Tax=[Phormidium] sp. ETS-05 TaxID=222819 RepID=UPI0018EEDD44|nr:hypothetical protein [[Phormidium] sp. ETS-05]